MKHKVAFVLKNKDLIKELGQEINPIFCSNVIELFQTYGSQKIDMIALVDEGSLSKEFKGILSFLRGKAVFQKTPIVLLYEKKDFHLNFLLMDPLVRGYELNIGIENALSHTSETLLEKDPFLSMTADEMVELSFQSYLNKNIPSETEWKYRNATEADMQESIFMQIEHELSTHILHIKFNLRILEKGLRSMMEQLEEKTDSEIESLFRKQYVPVIKEFVESLNSSLAEAGAIHVPDIMQMQAQERIQVLKHHDEQSFLFESSVATIILEMTRYI